MRYKSKPRRSIRSICIHGIIRITSVNQYRIKCVTPSGLTMTFYKRTVLREYLPCLYKKLEKLPNLINFRITYKCNCHKIITTNVKIPGTTIFYVSKYYLMKHHEEIYKKFKEEIKR